MTSPTDLPATVPSTVPSTVHAVPAPAAGIRASDVERETVAARLRDAAADGRLTMPEADERLTAAYAAATRGELARLTTDLPPVAPPAPEPGLRGLTPAARRRLAVHAAIVAVLAVNLVVRFLLSGAPFFFPAFPIVFLLGTLAAHYAFARRSASSIHAVSRGTIAA